MLALAPCAQPGVQWPRLMQRGAALVVGRGDRAVRRPPVPAQLVHGRAEARARLAERQGRHGRLMRRVRRIAGQARHAHHAVVLGEEGIERFVVDRPVVGHAVQRLHLEVRRMQARIVRGVHDGAAAHAVEVHHLDGRVGVVDGIVGLALAAIGAGGKVAEEARLPVAPVAGIVGGLHPVALLEAEDAHPGFREAPGHGGARCAGADDQNVDLVVHLRNLEPQLRWRQERWRGSLAARSGCVSKGEGFMPTIDVQVHCYERNHPGRPWVVGSRRPARGDRPRHDQGDGRGRRRRRAADLGVRHVSLGRELRGLRAQAFIPTASP